MRNERFHFFSLPSRPPCISTSCIFHRSSNDFSQDSGTADFASTAKLLDVRQMLNWDVHDAALRPLRQLLRSPAIAALIEYTVEVLLHPPAQESLLGSPGNGWPYL